MSGPHDFVREDGQIFCTQCGMTLPAFNPDPVTDGCPHALVESSEEKLGRVAQALMKFAEWSESAEARLSALEEPDKTD